MRSDEARLAGFRRSRAATVAAILMAVVISSALAGVTGCESALEREVNERLAEVDTHQNNSIADIQKFEEAREQLKGIFDEAFGTDIVGRARAALGTAQASLNAALTEVQEIEKILLEIKGMAVSPDMKTYCEMKVSALDELEQTVDLELKAMQVLGQAIDQFEAGGEFDILLQQVAQLESEAQKHAEESSRLNLDASDFFEEKKLGR